MVTLKFKIMISAKRQKFGKAKSNFQYFFNFFQIFMIWFGQIELAFYPNKALDSMQKKLLTKNLKFEKKSKIRNSFGINFPRFDSIRFSSIRFGL
jgi:hypothetical protein